MVKKICINEDDCVGCGLCSSNAPELFSLDESQFKAKIKETGELSKEKVDQVNKVMQECPTQAIKLIE